MKSPQRILQREGSIERLGRQTPDLEGQGEDGKGSGEIKWQQERLERNLT